MAESENLEIKIPAGKQLKHLREQKNFSMQDVASRLNLEARIIDAIEDNNTEMLPAAIYTRGYLRSYAKILGVDPASIISSYNDTAPEPPEIIPEVKHATQTSSSDKPVKAFTYLISLTLVILLVAWWQSNFIVDNINLIGSGDTGEGVNPAYGLSYPITVVRHPTSPFYRSPDAREQETAVAVEADTETQIDTETATDNENDKQYPQNVTSDSEGPDVLVLRLTADSWIEIYDALEIRVYVNLAHEGQILTLHGTAPFAIVLGFAEGVSIDFNGEPFDTKPYTRGGIARFNLDR